MGTIHEDAEFRGGFPNLSASNNSSQYGTKKLYRQASNHEDVFKSAHMQYMYIYVGVM